MAAIARMRARERMTYNGKEELVQKSIVAVALMGIGGGLALGAAHAAEKYPVKPISAIVAVEAGADGDVLVRPIFEQVSKMIGQPITVVNKPGGGSSIGYRELHRARPDGYTIGWGSATIITNKLQGVMPFNHHDFTMLGAYATYFPIVVASTGADPKLDTIEEAIKHAKANPGKLNMATAGVGAAWWVAATAFINATGIKVNTIPQPGAGALTIAQVAGGHAELGVAALGSAKSMLDAGKVKFLATLGEARAPAPYDKIPTLKELGYDVVWESTNFIMGPPKMSKEAVAVLVPAIEKAAKDSAFVKFAESRNTRWEYIAPEKMTATFDKREVVVREVMQKAGILKEAKK